MKQAVPMHHLGITGITLFPELTGPGAFYNTFLSTFLQTVKSGLTEYSQRNP